jgi:hypothetical protein
VSPGEGHSILHEPCQLLWLTGSDTHTLGAEDALAPLWDLPVVHRLFSPKQYLGRHQMDSSSSSSIINITTNSCRPKAAVGSIFWSQGDSWLPTEGPWIRGKAANMPYTHTHTSACLTSRCKDRFSMHIWIC